MKKIITILMLGFLVTGCNFKKFNTEPVQPKVKSAAELARDQNLIIDPTEEGRRVWLDTFIQAGVAVHSVTEKLYLHDKDGNRQRLIDQNDKLFDALLFDVNEYKVVVDNPEKDLRDKMIKALLMVVQIRIETDLPDQEVESGQNVKARKELATIKRLAGERVDLDITSLKLDCQSLQGCISKFEEITDERR